MKKLFVHLASDQVMMIVAGEEPVIVPYVDLERRLPVVMHELFASYTIGECVVLHGPGSFTILRIGALCLNLIQDHGQADLVFRVINKLDLYRALLAGGQLPSCGLIFVGQRKKLLPAGVLEQVGEEIESTMLLNQGQIEELVAGVDYRVDRVSDHLVAAELDQSMMLRDWQYDGQQLYVSWRECQLMVDVGSLGSMVSRIEPAYMMEPTMH